jgi:triose/dihydroxyacetone kinase / FAD-AMP lyase (cyclizing)
VALRRLIKAEPEITKYDTIVGDGDCGVGLKRGAEGNKSRLFQLRLTSPALIDMLDKSEPTDDLAVFLGRIVRVVESSMDGTSGALYFIFLQALTRNIRGQSTGQVEDIQVGVWARALEASIRELAKYTPAQPGDRTLVDALHPFVDTLSRTGSVEQAAAAAAEGSKKTMSMKASLGRSVYVGGKGWQEVPDPGAYGLSELLLGLAQGLQ